MRLYHNQLNVSMADSSAVTPEVVDVLSDAKQYYYQSPNRKTLGIPWKLAVYSLSNPEKDNWLNNLLRTKGEAPVVYDRIAAQRTSSQLATLLKAKGCFNSTVTFDTVHRDSSSLNVVYHILATPRRKIDDVEFACRQHDIDSLLQKWKNDSYLKAGDYYDQQKMTAEQSRIATNLKNEGYYYANNDLIRFYVDTTYDNRLLSIRVVVRLPQSQTRDSNHTPSLQKYHIDNIYIYPNVPTSPDNSRMQFDTLIYPYQTRRALNHYYFIYDKKIAPSPTIISRSLFLFNGMTYRPRFVNSTRNSLLGLHNFKYVDIDFQESPNSSDSNRLLDARIRLINSNRQALSLSFELTNASSINSDVGNFFTSGNLGLGTTLGYMNKNLFGSAELLNIEGNLIIDLPKNVFGSGIRDFYHTFSTFEMGLNTSLDLPDFLMPFANSLLWQTTKPHTLIELSSNYIYRKLALPFSDEYIDIILERFLVGSSFGYTWNQGSMIKHKLLPFNLSYSHLISGDSYYIYLSLLTGDPKFIYQAFDYVLLNTHYEYTFSNQTIGSRNNFNYLRFSVETAGNLLSAANSLITHLSHTPTDTNVIFYQYFRFDGEFKRYIYLGNNSTLVVRALAGFGLPYGHSNSIPYEKMFVGGGPTTMRGWGLRHLGPGLTSTSESNFALGTGDIQLVANIEHRFPIMGIFEGAIFADMGNVWDTFDWGIGKNQQFTPSDIIHGVAIDAGLGIRANVSIVTLRVDVAVPLYDPGYPSGERWIGSHWAWDKLVANFGINYPF